MTDRRWAQIMTDRLWAQVGQPSAEADAVSAPTSAVRPVASRPTSRRNWLREPRSAVWLALAAIVGIGGGRRLLWSLRARKAIARLSSSAVTADELEAAAGFGRAGAWDLLRIFSTSDSDEQRAAAGRALARLWRDDQLVAEEEQSIVRRGFAVTWSARKRYPRALHAPIPIVARYGIPFLDDDTSRMTPDDLEWSHRILGARRAALEEPSEWKAGPGEIAFSIVPDDFPTSGPHRLVLQARVRMKHPSGSWQFELPHVPFQLEFDPVLRLDAILTVADATRDDAIAQAIHLEPSRAASDAPARLVPLGGEWVLRNPPILMVRTPLPSDLAHRSALEFAAHPGRFPAVPVVLSGQGLANRGGTSQPTGFDRSNLPRRFDIRPLDPLPEGVIDRPGIHRIRVHLEADPQLGWADADVRSVWPGSLATNWVEAEIIRR